ncbi:MAG: hypothetical protein OXU83_00235 [Gammaproteobacteria bacterium]|nr:hypothetical protein [Gammaproteobacteria bacterium]
MEEKFSIFVEGDEDSWFLQGYLDFLGQPFSNVCVKSIDGWGNLAGRTQEMAENLDKGISVLIIFDANANSHKRRGEIKKILNAGIQDGKDLPLFLFPDDQSNGAVEDLLGQIIIPEHEGIFTCFENYRRCLKEKNSEYILPGMKGKMYSYKEALGVIQEMQKGRSKKEEGPKQYTPDYWDFDNPALEPLKAFLMANIE